jgi:hypothetical protein
MESTAEKKNYKFIIDIKKKYQISSLILYLKDLEKEQSKPKYSRRKCLRIITEIDKIEDN